MNDWAQHTVDLAAPGFNICPRPGVRAQIIKQVADRYRVQFIAVDFQGDEGVESLTETLLDVCRDRSLVPGPIIFVAFARGTYVASWAPSFLMSEGRSVDLMLIISPTVYHHDPEHSLCFPAPTARDTFALHGFQDVVSPVSAVIDYCSDYGVTLHRFPDDHQLLTGFPLTSDIRDNALIRSLL